MRYRGWRTWLAFALGVAGVLGPEQLPADVIIWENPASGVWSAGANWLQGHPPGAGDVARVDKVGLPAGTPYTVTFDPNGTTTVTGFEMATPDAIFSSFPNIFQTLIVNGGSDLTGTLNLTNFTWTANGSVSNFASVNLAHGIFNGSGGPFHNNGTVTMRSNVFGQSEINIGLLNDHGTIDVDSGILRGMLSNEPDGVILLDSSNQISGQTSASLQLGASLSNHGLIQMRTSGSGALGNSTTIGPWGGSGGIINDWDGTIDIQPGGARTISVPIDNRGMFNIGAAATINPSSAAFLNSGMINVASGGLTVSGFSSFTNTGPINASGGSLTFAGGDATWTNASTIDASGGGMTFTGVRTWTNNGTITVGGGNFSLTGVSGATSTSLVNNGQIVVPPGRNFTTLVGPSNVFMPLTIANGATLDGGGTLNLNYVDLRPAGAYSPGTSNVNLTNSTIGGAGSFTNPAGTTTTMTMNGAVSSSSRIAGTVANEGTWTFRGNFTELPGTFTNEPGGTLRLETVTGLTNATLRLGNNHLVNHGRLEMAAGSAGGTIEIDQIGANTGNLVNETTGTIDVLSGGARNIGVAVDNRGTMNLGTGMNWDRSTAQHTNSGTINVNAGGLTVSGFSSFTNTGPINASGGGLTFAGSDATWTNTSTIDAAGGGMTFTSTRTWRNDGDITLGGGNFSITGVSGATSTTLVNNGHITVAPGRTFNTIVGPSNVLMPLTIANGATLDGGGTLNLNYVDLRLAGAYSPGTSNVNLTNSTIGGAGSLTNAAGSTVEMTRNTAVSVNSRVATTVNNSGTWIFRGSFTELSGSFTNAPGATARVEAVAGLTTAQILVGANDLVNHGLFQMSASVTGNTVSIGRFGTGAGKLVNEANGTFEITGNGARNIGVPFDNRGTVLMNNHLVFNRTGLAHLNSGTWRILAGTIFFFASNTLTNQPTGVIEGVGGVDLTNGDIVFANQGTIRPGLSAGTFTVTGNYTQTATGQLDIEIGGAATAAYDRLTVSGIANLNGSLEVDLIDGYMPQPGQTFTVLTYGSRSGMFSSVEYPTNFPGLGWTITYAPTSVVLTTTPLLVGDIDLDGDVDRTDAAMFSQHFGAGSGSIWTTGDFDGDAATTLNDWALLQTHLGQSVSSPLAMPAAVGVPEPSAIWLAILAFALIGLRRRR